MPVSVLNCAYFVACIMHMTDSDHSRCLSLLRRRVEILESSTQPFLGVSFSEYMATRRTAHAQIQRFEGQIVLEEEMIATHEAELEAPGLSQEAMDEIRRRIDVLRQDIAIMRRRIRDLEKDLGECGG